MNIHTLLSSPWSQPIIGILGILLLIPLLMWLDRCSQRSSDRHQKWVKDFEEKEKSLTAVFHDPNGLVVVNIAHLSLKLPSHPITNASLIGLRIPPEVEYVLCHLGFRERLNFTIWLSKNSDTEDIDLKSAVDDTRRGLTIGSALFNYSIPESSVLIDRRTRLLHALYIYYYERCLTVNEWVKKEGTMIAAHHHLISDVERNKLSCTKKSLVVFYNKHVDMVIENILVSGNTDKFPSINGFVRVLLNKLGLDSTDDNQVHYMRICISVVTSNLQVKVPISWVMMSEMVNYLQDMIHGVSQKETKLKLVINNSIYENKPL